MSAALVAAVALVSCSGEPEPPAGARATTTPTPSESATEAPSPTGTPTPPCAAEIEAGERLPGGIEGDVDGDGTVDDVFLVRSDSAAAECRTLLVVEGAATTYAASTDDPAMPYSLLQPRLNRLAHVDDAGGAEVLVDVESGASTQFLGMFTIADGLLQRVRLEGDSGLGDLLPYGGSVGHIEASNCPLDRVEDQDVVIAVATPRGPRYLIERTYYDLVGATLVPVAREEERLPVEALSQEHDYVTSPFGSCVVNP